MALHLVTGGSGFVGSKIVELLEARGEDVRVLDIIDSPNRSPAVQFIRGDILDPTCVDRAMKGIDYVHHEAALVPVAKAGPQFFRVNEEGTKVVLEAARKEGVKKFVYMSSCAIFAGALDRCPLREDTPPKSLEIYGESKLRGEILVTDAMDNGMPCISLRPQCIIGKERLGVFQILFDWIRDNKRIYVIGSGNNLFQFTHVGDLAEMSIRAAESDKTGIYNVAAERFGSIREDVGALIKHANSKSKITGIPVALTVPLLTVLDKLKLSPLGPFHYRIYHKPLYYDLSKIKQDFAWSPKYSNAEMLIEAYEWFDRNYESVMNQAESKSTHRSPVKQGVLKALKWIS